MYSERTVLDLVGSIYDAAGEPRQWPCFLEKLAGALKSKSTTLFVQDLRSQHGNSEIDFNFDPAFRQAYVDYYAEKNIYLIGGKHVLRPGLVTPSERLCPDEEAHRSEFYNDWIVPQDQRYGLLGVLFQEQHVTSMLGAIRSWRAPAFSEEDTRFVRALMPHLQRALQLQRRLVELEKKHAATTAALNHWSLGVIVVDARGRILLMNRAAEAILNQRDGISAESYGLHAALPQETATLRGLIRGATHTTNGNGLHAGGILPLSRPSLKRPLSVLVTPATRQHGILACTNAAALVFVSDPEANEEGDETTLGRLYGLTPAESAVAARLIQGKDVKNISEDLTVEANTVRVHLKRIFAKTGAKRQAELVRLLLSGPGSIRLKN